MTAVIQKINHESLIAWLKRYISKTGKIIKTNQAMYFVDDVFLVEVFQEWGELQHLESVGHKIKVSLLRQIKAQSGQVWGDCGDCLFFDVVQLGDVTEIRSLTPRQHELFAWGEGVISALMQFSGLGKSGQQKNELYDELEKYIMLVKSPENDDPSKTFYQVAFNAQEVYHREDITPETIRNVYRQRLYPKGWIWRRGERPR
jgi:hypothetical protein